MGIVTKLRIECSPLCATNVRARIVEVPSGLTDSAVDEFGIADYTLSHRCHSKSIAIISAQLAELGLQSAADRPKTSRFLYGDAFVLIILRLYDAAVTH
jgi:hypothetical protein